MAPHSSVLNQRLPWTEKPGGLYSQWGCEESDTTEATEHAHASSGRQGSDCPSPQLGQRQWFPWRAISAVFLVFWQL